MPPTIPPSASPACRTDRTRSCWRVRGDLRSVGTAARQRLPARQPQRRRSARAAGAPPVSLRSLRNHARPIARSPRQPLIAHLSMHNVGGCDNNAACSSSDRRRRRCGPVARAYAPRSAAAGARTRRALPSATPTRSCSSKATRPMKLSAILAVAGHVRTRLKGTGVTYSPKVFLPVTNLCRDRCSYCTFRSDPDDAHAWTMLPEEIRACSRNGRTQRLHRGADVSRATSRRSRFVRIARPCKSSGTRARSATCAQACEIALEEGLLPHTNAGLMSRDEMAALKPVNASMGLMLENISPRLRHKGEAHYYAPDKDPDAATRDDAPRRRAGIPFTTGILLGIGETARRGRRQPRRDPRPAPHATDTSRRSSSRTSAPSRRRAWPQPEPESLEIARTIAVARLMVARHEHPGTTEPQPVRSSPVPAPPASTTGAASRR